MAAPAYLLQTALSKRPGIPALVVVPGQAPPPDDFSSYSAEAADTELPLTSEPPLADAAPLTSEPPLADAAPLTSEPTATGMAALADPSAA